MSRSRYLLAFVLIGCNWGIAPGFAEFLLLDTPSIYLPVVELFPPLLPVVSIVNIFRTGENMVRQRGENNDSSSDQR